MKPFIVLAFFVFISCSGSESDAHNDIQSEIPQVNDQFQLFLDEFPKVQLPLDIKGCDDDFSRLTEFGIEKKSPYIKGNAYAYGQIQTNGNFVAVITLGTADCFLPEIRTFKLNGEKIDTKTIAIGYCGSGPCYECSEFMSITEDYIIYTSDTIKTAECDEDFNPIPGTESIEVIYKEGKLKVDGRIELSSEKEGVIK